MRPHASSDNYSFRFVYFMAFLVWASGFFLPCRSYGIEPNSALFDKSSSSSTTNGSQSVPLDLPSETPSASPSLLDTLGRVLAALTLVIVLIVATVWGLKLIWDKKGLTLQGEDGKSLRILSSVFIGPRKTIHLVEVGKRILVVGVGNEEIHPLDVITDPEEVEDLKKSSRQGFPVLLEKILHRSESSAVTEDTEKIIAESKKTLGGYIKSLKGAARKSPRRPDESEGLK
jgi:flagellar biogenesis protein FliO